MLRGTRRSLDFIIVDYLQIMGTERFNENRAVELGVITTRLKTLAKELGCPMIVLSQLSRETSKRQDPRPILTDLRDSGAIEQDADKVILLHRQEYYEPHNPEFQGSAEAIVAKNRQGACGVAKLAFLKEFTKFGNYQHRQ
jgi:replicative DNA helicase